MANYDNNILIENINKLMKDNNITQTALAEILGMSQSNVSKALSSSDKKNFTLDQIVGIAKYFHISIDSLIGNHSGKNRDISPRTVAEYFVRLIESNIIETFKHPLEEDIFEPYVDESGCLDTHRKKATVNYNAFYFPSYWHVDEKAPQEEQLEQYSEMSAVGNDKLHKQTNKFLYHFLQIYTIYKQGGLTEETYRTVVSDLLNQLR